VHDRGLAIEAKFMRESLSRKRIGDEIAADILRYSGHPVVQGLLVVVYDPQKRYSNPAGLQTDVQALNAGFPVRVVVVS
jgi:hypothetical protein